MAFLILKEGDNFIYKSSEHLLAGLDTSPEDEDSLEILEIHERFVGSILEKFTTGNSRSEEELIEEVMKGCESIDGLNSDFLPEILAGFTNFFVYDFETGEFVISKNIEYKLKGSSIIVYTKERKRFLLEFAKAKPLIDGPWPPAGIDKKLSSFIKKVFQLIAFIACFAFLFRLGVGLYNKWYPFGHQDRKEEMDTINNHPINDTFNSNVVNDLEMNGKLYIKEDSTLITRYFISNDKNKDEKSIEWNDSFILSSKDTLFPKDNCYIYMLTTGIFGNKRVSKFERFDFNICRYIELLIKTNSRSYVLDEMLNCSFSQPLTILYDKTTEETCMNPDDDKKDVLITNLENNAIIDSVIFYSNKNRQNILSRNYPQIKFIGCSTNN